jgi:GNAT superfamily N-acetyltransferase
MLRIYNIKEKKEYIKEVAELTYNEWGKPVSSAEEYNIKIKNKIAKIISYLDNKNYCKLILLDDNILVGFISIFENDCEERKDLAPWYATMYVKKEYRSKGYSRILNDAILKEAKNRNYKKIYLKTDLDNYYEKLANAKYMEYLKNGEKLYYIDLTELDN